MEWKNLLILVVINVVYILLGGLFFHLLESGNENESKEDLSIYKKKFLGRYRSQERDQSLVLGMYST